MKSFKEINEAINGKNDNALRDLARKNTALANALIDIKAKAKEELDDGGQDADYQYARQVLQQIYKTALEALDKKV